MKRLMSSILGRGRTRQSIGTPTYKANPVSFDNSQTYGYTGMSEYGWGPSKATAYRSQTPSSADQNPFNNGAVPRKGEMHTAISYPVTPTGETMVDSSGRVSGRRKIMVKGTASVENSLGDMSNSERIVPVSTAQRANWAAQAMANRVQKTGDVNAVPAQGKKNEGRVVKSPSPRVLKDKRDDRAGRDTGW